MGSFCLNLQFYEIHFVHRNRLDEKQQLESENNVITQQPAIHVGAVASGDSVIKSVAHRNRIAKQENVIAFEMEEAGVWDEVPCVVMKGVVCAIMLIATSTKNGRILLPLWQLRQRRPSSSATRKQIGRNPKRGHLKSLMPRKMPNHRRIL
jgi:hypothetical protein